MGGRGEKRCLYGRERKKIKALFVWMAEVKEELSKPQTPSLADLLITYYNQRNAGAWSNKARTGNLKQFA